MGLGRVECSVMESGGCGSKGLKGRVGHSKEEEQKNRKLRNPNKERKNPEGGKKRGRGERERAGRWGDGWWL